MPKHPEWLVINGCPAPYLYAAQIAIVLEDAGQTASSIYRGTAPAAVKILHAHGKHTQTEIHADPQYASISNPAGFSQHELRSDYPQNNKGIARGKPIPKYMVGIDSGGNDQASKDAITRAAAKHGWKVVHPYSAGVEGHHWRFDEPPHATKAHPEVQKRIAKLRKSLPRH